MALVQLRSSDMNHAIRQTWRTLRGILKI